MITALSHHEVAWDPEETPPVELVTLAQAKEYARVDGAGDDNVIVRLIQSERRWIERYTGNALVMRRARAFYGGFLGRDLPGHTAGMRNALELPVGPLYVQAGNALRDQIDEIAYETVNAAGQVVVGGLASDGFEVVFSTNIDKATGGAPNWHERPLLRPKAGTAWPSTRGDGRGGSGGGAGGEVGSSGGDAALSGKAPVHVTYRAGLVQTEADRAIVPAELIQVLLDRIHYKLDNRGQPMPMALQQEFERVCDPYRVFTV